MKYFITTTLSAVLFVLLFSPSLIYGQGVMSQATATPQGVAHRTAGSTATNKTQAVNVMAHDLHPGNAMTAMPHNYKWFTAPYINTSAEAIKANAGYEHHPELGMLFSEKPCDNCYELIGKRTEISKTFIKEGTNGRDIMQQTSSEPMHYRDAQGNWRTVKTKLEADNNHKGIYAAYEQPVPVSINTNNGNSFSAIGKEGQALQFNHNLELVYSAPDGRETSLGAANWTNYTAGDDGLYVKDAWPGIDIEIYVFRGGMKTNFMINRALPVYAAGKLLVRDHLQMGGGLTLGIPGETKSSLSPVAQTKYTGRLAVKNATGSEVYVISDASVFEKNNAKATYQQLEYYITGNTLDIALPGNFLNRPEASYPVVIDPLVSVATTLPIPPDGSTFTTTLAAMSGCLYTNPATTPANVTITDIRFANQYTSRNGAWLQEGFTDFYLGTCRSPVPPTGFGGMYWFCNLTGGGTCTADGTAPYSIFGDFSACIPAPRCTPYNLNVKMYLYQDYQTTAACNNQYVYLSQPLIITVYGHTVEITAAGVTAAPATICAGTSSTLSVAGVYGVPPYTWAWVPGGMTGTPVVVTPTVTTTYSTTVTDACGITATSGVVVTVRPAATITGNPTVCVGNTTTLSNGGVAGTWSSVTPAVATVVAASGVVTGVSAGTSVIRFITTAGACTSSITVTVTPVPVPITGITTLCVGSTTTLSDSPTGGTWSSGSSSIASVNPSSGVVTGLSSGTVVITYSLGGACIRTASVTVNLLAPITGITTVCVGGNTTLSNAAGAGTWSSGSTAVATVVTATGVVYGVSAGTSVITFTTPSGCSTTATVTVNAIAPITGNMSICMGGSTTLSDAAGTGTWSSSNPAVATVVTATGVVYGVSIGTSNITFITPSGCSAVTTVTVNALAPITGTLSICLGGTTTLTDAAAPGTWSSSNTAVATINATTGDVSSVATGNTTITFTTTAGCYTTAVLTVNGIFPIGGPSRVCQGNTITLTNAGASGTWTSSNTAIATIGISSGIVTGVSAGSTTITYITPGSCMVTAIITVDPLPANITGATQVCIGLTAQLSDATPGGAWSSSGGVSVNPVTGAVTGVSAGTATITYTSALGCTITASFTVNPLPAAITGNTSICIGATSTLADTDPGGIWSTGSAPIATVGVSSGVVTGVSAGTTNITYTLPTSCIITTPVTIKPIPLAPGTTNLDYCQHDSLLPPLTATGTGLQWYTTLTGGAPLAAAPVPSTFTPGITTWYVSQSANGCESDRAPLQVTVHIKVPRPFIAANKPYDCQFDTIGLHYSGPSFAGTTYAWVTQSYAPIVAGSAGGPAITVRYDTTIGNNNIVLTVGDGYPVCNVTDTYSVLVYLASPVAAFYMKPYACVGDSVDIGLSYVGTGVKDYTWNFDGGNIVVASSDHGGPYKVVWNTQGIHTVSLAVVSNADCPSRVVKDTIDVHPLPDAQISWQAKHPAKTFCVGDSIQVWSANYSPDNNYAWAPTHFFGLNNRENVYGKIERAGYVTLRVTSPFGCVATDSVLIDPPSCCDIVIPNTFTPNGDGLNDIFRPVTLGNHTLHIFRVDNRWGQTVYESVNERTGWDGNFNGIPQDLGVYFYYLQYDCDGKTLEEKGEVNLIR